MKQFEKMYKSSIFAKEPCHLLTGDPINGGVLSRVLKEDIECVWRAALKCVQQKIEFGQSVAYSDTDVLMAIKKEIKEELQDGST